jgi:hypothetical protein
MKNTQTLPASDACEVIAASGGLGNENPEIRSL